MRKAILLLTIWVAMGVSLTSADERPLPSDVKLVATLLSDTYAGETILLARITGDVKLDDALWVEARGGEHRDLVEVEHVFGSYILIKQELPRSKLIGSRLYQ